MLPTENMLVRIDCATPLGVIVFTNDEQTLEFSPTALGKASIKIGELVFLDSGNPNIFVFQQNGITYCVNTQNTFFIVKEQ